MSTNINQNLDFRGFAHTYTQHNRDNTISDSAILTANNWGAYRIIRSGTTTPGYKSGRAKKTIRKFALPMNPFAFQLHRWSGYQGTKTVRVVDPRIGQDDTHYTIGQWNNIPNTDDLTATDPSAAQLNSLDALARSKVLLEMKDQKVNLAQAYAERMQTVRMFENTVKRVTEGVVHLRKANWNAAARSFGLAESARKHRKHIKRMKKDPDSAVANAWLELQYGWRPLLEDVHGSAELIAQKNLREVRTRVRKSVSGYEEGVARDFQSGSEHHLSEYTLKYTVSYIIYYATPSDSIKTLAQVGITNPALIVWELTPWSFVVDWLLPVGNFLSSLDATTGLVFEKGCKTVFSRYTRKNTIVGGMAGSLNSPTGYQKTEVHAKSQRELVKCNRTVISSFPRPSLPRFKNPFGPEHLANLTALMRQTFKR